MCEKTEQYWQTEVMKAETRKLNAEAKQVELQNQGCWQAKEPHNVKEEKIVCKRCGSEEFNILKDSIHTVRCARCNFEVSYWNVGKITWLK